MTNPRLSKLGICAIALICCSTVFAVTLSDDSSADGVTYRLYIQLEDDTDDIRWLDPQSAEEVSCDSFVNCNNSALDAAGYGNECIASSGWILGIGSYQSDGSWGSEGYKDFAVFYADGDEWTLLNNYAESAVNAIVFCKYLSQDEYDALSAEKQAEYVSMWGMYAHAPSTTTTGYESSDPEPSDPEPSDPEPAPTSVTYQTYIQLEGDTSDIRWLKSQSADEVSVESFVKCINAALDDAGYGSECLASSGWVRSIGDYKDVGDWGFSGYKSFAVFYADGDEWRLVNDYTESAVNAIVYSTYLTQDEYDALSAEEKGNYVELYGTYIHTPTVSATSYSAGDSDDDGDDLVIIAGVAAAILVIAVVACAVCLKAKQ